MDLLNIACYNARGIMPSACYIGQLLDNHDIDILGISEHWLFPNMLCFLDSIHPNYCGFGISNATLDPIISHHRGKGGVAFVYKKSLKPYVSAIDIENDRMCGLSLKLVNNIVINLIMMYLPSSACPIADYSQFIEIMYDIQSKLASESSELIFLGDLNCEIFGEKCDRQTPYRGTMMKQFMEDGNLVSVSTMGICEGPAFSFDPQDGQARTTLIDHILIDKNSVGRIEHCRIIDEEENSSDHLPVLLSISQPTVCADAFITNYKVFKWDKYSKEVIKTEYTERIKIQLKKSEVRFEVIENVDQLQQYYEYIVAILLETSEKYIGCKSFNMTQKPYWSEALTELHNVMIIKRRKWIDLGNRKRDGALHREYKDAKCSFRRVFRKAQEEWEKEEYEEIERNAEVDTKLFWHLIKKKRQNHTVKEFTMKFEGKVCVSAEEIAKGWANYFAKLYQPLHHDTFDDQFKKEMEEKLDMLLAQDTGYNEILDKPIDEEELDTEIRLLKLGKTGGHDNLTNEHVVYGGEALIKHLCRLFSAMIKLVAVPMGMTLGLIITLLKPTKKEKCNPDNHRGITLLPILYKLFERTTLTRMYNFLKARGVVFPDPSQCAYQKLLSSLNASFNLQETINFNLERGSKVFVCMMDNVKAFDVVWHTGLYLRLFELGICNKLWRVIIKAYSNMENSVLYKGVRSDKFPVLQSSRQGSHWGTLFYMAVINPILREIRQSGVGAYVGDVYAGIHAQADDVALVATSKTGLQMMIDRCYQFSTKWRYLIHPIKSKILVYGESGRRRVEHSGTRVWKIGENIVKEVENQTHCGILFTTQSTVMRTKLACRKGRGIMSAICNQAKLGQGNLNPLTALRLYKTITLSSALYGCELWTHLSRVEITMLERMQRYCAKLIQGLGTRTRSNICCSMLGLVSVETHIDCVKMKFFRRLGALSSNHLSKQIFIRRLFQNQLRHSETTGYGHEIVTLLHKYNLQFALFNLLENAYIPDKLPWKFMIRQSAASLERSSYNNNIKDDPDFTRFIRIHPDNLLPSPLWRVAKAKPSMLVKCVCVAKIIATPPNQDKMLCEYCGHIFKDWVVHYCCNCSHTVLQREQFWDIVHNAHSMELAVFMYNQTDDDLVDILLGAPCMYLEDIEMHINFLCVAINFLYKLMSKVTLF